MAQGWGERLRVRARELGLSDSEVARRVGIAQRRYSTYVNQSRQPDFDTLARVCRALDVTPDWVLAFTDGPSDRDAETPAMTRAVGALRVMPEATLGLAADMLQLLAEHANTGRPED